MTGNTQELQWRPSPSQKFFTGVMKRTISGDLAKQMKSSNDPQGMYILGPDGKSYGFTNDHYPDDIQRFMNSCLAKYRKDPPAKVTFTQEELNSSFSHQPPPGAAVVRVFARIWPLPKQCWGLNRGAGRDFLWIYPEELKYLAHAAANKDGQLKLPAALTERLVRFHLLDDVRGTPDMWHRSEVKSMKFKAKVVGNANAANRQIEFTGAFSMKTASGGRGFTGNIKGKIEVAVKDNSIVKFSAYSDGKAWGRGTYTPFPPEGKYGLHIGFVNAKDEVARVVPPEAVSTANNDREYHDPSIEGGGDRGK